jgi:hypothetical protein
VHAGHRISFAKKAGYKIAGVWKETASGAKDDRAERKEVLALAQQSAQVGQGRSVLSEDQSPACAQQEYRPRCREA